MADVINSHCIKRSIVEILSHGASVNQFSHFQCFSYGNHNVLSEHEQPRVHQHVKFGLTFHITLL